MHLNYWAIALATVLQFIAGAIWYMPIFGKLWAKIHGFDKVPKEQQENMTKSMAPLLMVELLATLVTTTVLAILIKNLPSTWNVFGIAVLLWIGFVVPVQIGAVLFGETKPQWRATKLLIMSGGSLLYLVIAAAVFAFFK
jgi:hypothetical protein